MSNTVIFEVIARAEVALKKLSYAQIPVSNLKIGGNKLTFGVNREYVKKVFAIFAHPCYNTVIRRKSFFECIVSFLKRRIGLAVGGALFVLAALLSQSVVLKIKVTGNASYLASQIISIANDCGAREFSSCRSLDVPLLKAEVLALNGVNFCSVTRRGSFLIIDVHAKSERNGSADTGVMSAKMSGVIRKLVVISGTALAEEGLAVTVGTPLIAPYEETEEGVRADCIAAGYAEIEVTSSLTLFYESESEENTASALAATALYSDSVIQKSYTVSPVEGGVAYNVEFTYIFTQSHNMD